jgi:hypothetical protein
MLYCPTHSRVRVMPPSLKTPSLLTPIFECGILLSCSRLTTLWSCVCSFFMAIFFVFLQDVLFLLPCILFLLRVV